MTRSLAFLALVLALPAAAQDALIAKISGAVSFRTEGSARWMQAKGGEELLYGDRVKTGAGAVAHISLKDRGAILLRENTELRLLGSASRVTLNVPLGEFLIGLRRKLGKGESFRVQTPAAVAAVRGTLFWGKSDAEKNSAYAGFGHKVAISAFKKTVVLKPGTKVEVKYGQPPSDPAPSEVSLDYAKNFAIDGSLQDLEALADPAALKAPAPAPAPETPKNEPPAPKP